jgi:hypothetical protein
MKQSSIQIDRENRTVTIIMPLEKPRPSKSTGKTRVIATTGGLRTSAESYARRPVCFTANVFFYPPTPLNADDDGRQPVAGESVQGEITHRRGRRRNRPTADEPTEQ